MILYHGTYEENIEQIKKDGYIDNTKSLEDTLEIDRIIEGYTGKKITNNAVYLTNDIICTQMAYDYEFIVNTEQLNTDLLYVAEHTYRDEIFAYGNDCSEGVNAINNYIKSFIPFKDYINNNLKYESPEFLYFDKIYLEK